MSIFSIDEELHFVSSERAKRFMKNMQKKPKVKKTEFFFYPRRVERNEVYLTMDISLIVVASVILLGALFNSFQGS
jgi:hypothetical protein